MEAITLEQAKQMVKDSGFTPCEHRSWEDELCIYAFSQEGDASCFGHPKMTVSFDKVTGWISQSGKPSIKVARIPMSQSESIASMVQEEMLVTGSDYMTSAARCNVD